MGKLSITLATWDYDRIQGIKDGSVQVEGCEVTHIVASPKETFFRLFKYQEFDVSEMSFSIYILSRTNRDFPYIALPILLSRVFVHSGIFIRRDCGIKTPQDLKGRRVGVPSYQQTRGLCIRGMLSDEYGIKPTDLDWRMGGLDRPEDLQFVRQDLPKDIQVEPIPHGRTLSQMLAEGEIEAIFTARTPKCWRDKSPNVARLFPDYRAAELAYYKKTGIFPIMHLVGIRQSLAEKYPWLPRAIMKAFEEAKARVEPNLTEIDALITMLPWLTAEAENTIDEMGPDYWPYGVDQNRKTIEAQLRWAYEQGMSKKLWTVEEMFHPSTMTWYR
jgi:4,5-dihydroxyphthalate decarboxylase